MFKKIKAQQKIMSYMHQSINTKPTKRCNNRCRQFKTRGTNTRDFLFPKRDIN